MHDLEGYEEDPPFRDENDPEYKEELFRTFKYLGWRPEDLTTDPVWAAEYAEWLKTAPPADEER